MEQIKKVSNMDILQEQLTCSCLPYEDVKTFKQWAAEGLAVKKGEKAIRLHAHIETTKKDQETGKEEAIHFTKQFKACVFCRCQVEERKKVDNNEAH